jgi:membrane protein
VLGGLRGTFSRFFGNDGFFLAAGLAFVFLLCLIPIAVLGVSIAGFVLSTEQAAQEVVSQLGRYFPVYEAEISRALLRIVGTRKLSGLVGTAVLVLLSTWLFGAARLVMHRMLGIRGGRNPFRSLLIDAGGVVLLVVLLFGVAAVTWGANWFRDFVLVPRGVPGRWVAGVSVGVSVGTLAVLLYLGFRHVPYREVPRSAALAGAVVTSLLWEGAKQLFLLYVRRFGFYDQIYGPLGVLVAFVMFVYYAAIVFVFGAAYVAALDARRR